MDYAKGREGGSVCVCGGRKWERGGGGFLIAPTDGGGGDGDGEQ